MEILRQNIEFMKCDFSYTCPLDKEEAFKSDSISSIHSIIDGKKYQVPLTKQSFMIPSVVGEIFLSSSLFGGKSNYLSLLVKSNCYFFGWLWYIYFIINCLMVIPDTLLSEMLDDNPEFVSTKWDINSSTQSVMNCSCSLEKWIITWI